MDKMEKIGITALLSALFAWLGIVAVPFLLLVLLQIIDYATGLCAAKYRDEAISSYRSIKGIIKKVCMWLLVVVGGVLDWVITYAAESAGISFGVSFLFACLVCVWLLVNEIISILENMTDIGVKFPPFLLKIAQHIKAEAEKQGDAAADNEPKEEDGKDGNN